MPRKLLLLAFGTISPVYAHAAVVINELLPDPASSDAGQEWVELFNSGGQAVDISGWTLEVAVSGSTFSTKHTFATNTVISPGAYLVVGDPGLTNVDVNAGANLGLGNAGSNSDGVRLRNGGTVVDTVVYGSPNSEGIWDDSGAIATSFALVPGSGKSLARSSDGVDSQLCGSDFLVLDTPTRGATNGTPAVCTLTGTLVINEFAANPSGTDTDHEWVELYNAGAAADLSGWRLEFGTSSFSTDVEIPEGTLIGTGEFLVVGGGLAESVDVVVSGLSLGNASSSADGLRLVDCDDQARDTVIYGTPNSDNWLDDSGLTAISLAPAAPDGGSLARVEDGEDTQQNAVDFEVPELMTPGSSNSEGELDCGSGTLVINEALVDPEGADENREWVELYNAGKGSVDLSYYALQTATAEEYSDEVDFPSMLTLDAGEYFVVGGSTLPFVDLGFESFALPNGTNGDGIRLVDCHGEVVDTLVYGKSNEDLVVDDSGSVSDALASDPGEGESLARRENGEDSDACDLDFVVEATPTPGEPNPSNELDPCVTDTGDLYINEFLYDAEGDDDHSEWIEIYNGGDTSVSLTDWGIAYGGGSMVLPAGTSIPAHGYLVIGGSEVIEADLVRDFVLENSGVTITLTDCEQQQADEVLYGDSGVGFADEGHSLSRVSDGSDDWMDDATPTPGAENGNADVPGETDALPEPPSGGCGGDSAPGGGCNTVSGPAYLLLGLLAVRSRHL